MKGIDYMTIKVFINWDKQEALTETAYKAKMAEVKADENDLEEYVNDWLEDEIEDYIRYTLHETPRASIIFNLDEDDRQKIMENLRKNYEIQVEEDMEHDWEEFEFEV